MRRKSARSYGAVVSLVFAIWAGLYRTAQVERSLDTWLTLALDHSVVEGTGETRRRVRIAPREAGPTRPETHRPLSSMGTLVLINRN
jgi:hypothetical protein